jgi:glycogen phosphorylase
VSVQLYCGSTSAAGEIDQPQALVMSYTKALAPTRHVFTGKIECRTSGRQGFAIRVLPGAADLATPFEPGLILWN